MRNLFRSSNGIFVNFSSRYKENNQWNTTLKGEERIVERNDGGEFRVYCGHQAPADQLRIEAVEEWIVNEQVIYLAWLEAHPEMKQYA